MINDSPRHREKIAQAFQAARAVEAQINDLDFSLMPDGGERLVASLETAVAKHRQVADRKNQEARVDAIIKGAA